MATAKKIDTVLIVNPKDPGDPAPCTANVSDVIRRGWTLWSDRNDQAPDMSAKVRAAARANQTKIQTQQDITREVAEDGSAVLPSDIKKSPGGLNIS